ncbi:MAG: hypothetical protein ACREJ3_00815 [Polyangiaceae bacterium]
MSTRLWMVSMMATAMLACSAGPAGTGFGPVGGSDGTGAVSDDGGAPSVNTGNGSSGGTDPQGAPPAPAPVFSDAAAGQTYDTYIPKTEIAETKTLTIAPFLVKAGDEVYMCQQFANPFGRDVDLVKMDGQMSTGSHHFFVFNMSPATGRNTAAPLGPCPGAGLEFHPYIFLSQQPNWSVVYPEADMGYPLPAANGLMMNVHFLNATASDVMAQATITITAAVPGAVTKLVGNLFLNNQGMSVPVTPKSNPIWIPATTVPIADHDYQIIQSWSHMHQWGVDFQASLGSAATPFYDETHWDSPPVVNHIPPIQVKSGTPFTWRCQYYNDTGATLTFGDSARSSVMCIYFGIYYPVTLPTSDPDYPDIVSVVQL